MVFSPQAHLLPYMDQASLQNLINFNVQPLGFGSGPDQPATLVPLPVYLCPSDSDQIPGSNYGPTNYVASTGSGLVDNGTIVNSDGIFFSASSIRFRDITDGTTNTVCFSESLLGSGANPATGSDLKREVFVISGGSPTTPSACAAATAGGGTWSGVRGAKWVNGHYGDALYNHYYGPNSKNPDCGNAYNNYALTAARSWHVGGVQVLLCDGSARFVSENININIWHALGSRGGGEVIGDF